MWNIGKESVLAQLAFQKNLITTQTVPILHQVSNSDGTALRSPPARIPLQFSFFRTQTMQRGTDRQFLIDSTERAETEGGSSCRSHLRLEPHLHNFLVSNIWFMYLYGKSWQIDCNVCVPYVAFPLNATSNAYMVLKHTHATAINVVSKYL